MPFTEYLKSFTAEVTYRLPGELAKVSMRGSASLLADNSSIASEKKGFIMAPFANGLPVLWLEAEQINSLGKHSRVQPFLPIVSPHPYKSQQIIEIDEVAYKSEVEDIIEQIKGGSAGKVVLSRQIIVPLQNGFPVIELFHLLCDLYPDAFVYMANFPGFGLWLGASPETLIRFSNATLKTMALAGTRKAGDNRPWTEKDKEEHSFVVDYIREKLEKTDCSDIQVSAPYAVNAGKATHLCTGFSTYCKRESLINIVKSLHPTPAVCGMPSDKALEIIRLSEQHDRMYYAGYLGPVSPETADLFVNLRCMQIIEDKAVLYVGGGLTSASDPQAEWDETVLKSTTMLAAIEKMQNLAD